MYRELGKKVFKIGIWNFELSKTSGYLIRGNTKGKIEMQGRKEGMEL